MPAGTFGRMTDEGPGTISAQELFGGRRVVLFGVPGAFTPTCSARHLPGFVEQAPGIFAKGIDTIACMAVNDVYVMDAWGESQGVGKDVLMLADGNATYTRALGLAQDSTAFNMGIRSRRFAIVVDDGTATHVAVDEPGQFDVTSADAVLAVL
ncbi:MAG: peroxiredoxin [Woeseiaceae bacterium]|nr:peroxiredoxin [Woeseiaceae bacterium]